MKIAVFHNLPPGGGKRVLYEEVKALSKKHRLYLFEFTSTDEKFLDVRPFFEKVNRFRFKKGSSLPGFFGRLEKDYQNFVLLSKVHKEIAHSIDQDNFDVCLVHPDKLTQAPFLLRYLKTPSVYFCEELLRIIYEKELEFTERVIFLKRWYEKLTRILRKKIDKDNAESATRILVSSSYIKKGVKKAYLVDASVCPLGVDSMVFRPLYRKDRDQILFVGSSDKINGFDLFKKLRILDYGKQKVRFKQIIFSRNFTDKDLSKEYSKSILTLCSSYNEPFGLVALESMACETPVLAVDEGGYKETIADSKTGFLLKRSVRRFAKKISFLIKHPKTGEKIGNEGRKHVIKNWTWNRHISCLSRHLDKISVN